MSIDSLGPFQNPDTFVYGVSYLGPKDIFSLARVCKKYDKWSKLPDIWKEVSEREGIPLVANLSDEPRNPKEDFRVLYPITITSRKIGQFLGKVMGSVPPISQYWFEKLNQPDPYEKEKLCLANYVFVVVPSHIKRSVDKETPLDIDNAGCLVEVAADKVIKQELAIPFSLDNLLVLSKYPLKGKEHLPVFNDDPFDAKDPDETYLKLNTSFSEKVGVYFMRRNIVEKSKGLLFDQQELLVAAPNEGFEVTPIRIRALADSIFKLTSGTCPDVGRKARSSDIAPPYYDSVNQMIIGDFDCEGVGVTDDNHLESDESIGVVPGSPAEVPGSLRVAEGKAERIEKQRIQIAKSLLKQGAGFMQVCSMTGVAKEKIKIFLAGQAELKGAMPQLTPGGQLGIFLDPRTFEEEGRKLILEL